MRFPIAPLASSFACVALFAPPALAADDTTVFVARKIVTMDPAWPEATAVAVRDGKILSVGRTLDDLKPWLKEGEYRLDETFKDHVLVPGFVEAHGHPFIGAISITRPNLAYFPTSNPYGPDLPGKRSLAEVQAAIKAELAALADPSEFVIFWGYDSVAMGRHLSAADLDPITGQTPVMVWDCSEHFIYANTKAMEARGVDAASLKVPGVQAGPDGKPNGQFFGVPAAQFAIAPVLEKLLTPESIRTCMKFLGDLGWKNGVTTTCDMSFGIIDFDLEESSARSFFDDPDRPQRCVVVLDSASLVAAKKDGAMDYARRMAASSDDKLIFLGIKFFADDAYLSFGMQIENPGYVDGRKGMWLTAPGATMVDGYRPWWNAGFHIHTHVNGNAGTAATVDALAALQAEKPRFDHRFTVQHYGIASTETTRRLAALGGIASVNPYYVHWRAELSAPFLGTERAHTAAGLRTLLDAGVVTALHTDTPVAPPHPLEEMWIAVQRIGALGGETLGPAERITPAEALRMVTIDAAWTLGVEDLVGSIRPGKFADFTVLVEDPLEVKPSRIRDLEIWGVVHGGRKFPASDIHPPEKRAASVPIVPPDAATSAAWHARFALPPGPAAKYAKAPTGNLAEHVEHSSGCGKAFWRTLPAGWLGATASRRLSAAE